MVDRHGPRVTARSHTHTHTHTHTLHEDTTQPPGRQQGRALDRFRFSSGHRTWSERTDHDHNHTHTLVAYNTVQYTKRVHVEYLPDRDNLQVLQRKLQHNPGPDAHTRNTQAGNIQRPVLGAHCNLISHHTHTHTHTEREREREIESESESKSARAHTRGRASEPPSKQERERASWNTDCT